MMFEAESLRSSDKNFFINLVHNMSEVRKTSVKIKSELAENLNCSKFGTVFSNLEVLNRISLMFGTDFN